MGEVIQCPDTFYRDDALCNVHLEGGYAYLRFPKAMTDDEWDKIRALIHVMQKKTAGAVGAGTMPQLSEEEQKTQKEAVTSLAEWIAEEIDRKILQQILTRNPEGMIFHGIAAGMAAGVDQHISDGLGYYTKKGEEV